MRRIALALLLLGCAEEPVSTGASSNANIAVSLLFEHEGCKVYRFLDAGHYRYYVRCSDGTQATGHTYSESCGKNCTRTRRDEIPTVNR